MAYWTVTNVTKNSFKANIYDLSSNFTSDNYIRLVYTSAYYGTRSVTMGNIKFQTISGISAKTFSTTFYDLSPGTTYTLYCYAQVNDSADSNAYYLIKNSSSGNGITFVTDSEERQMTAPNAPTLSGNRYEGSRYPNAWIYLSGMTDISARFVWQCKDTVTNEVYELELDDVDGVSVQAKEISFQSIVTDPKFCRTYKMRLGSIDSDDNSNYAWSGWSTFTTQPSNRLMNYPKFISRVGNKARIRFSTVPAYDYSYYQTEITNNASGNKAISMINKDDVTQGGICEFILSQTGTYTITVAAAYSTGSAVLYAADENGDRVTNTQTVSYLRPDYFGWTVTPQTGIATASVPSDDWNALCLNIYAVVSGYLGRGYDAYGGSNEIFLPADESLYGNTAGRSISKVLTMTETAATVGAKIDADKTLYAWRYNALNYILCCVNNSDSETDVTNADYAEHFAEGKPVYARYLTALSDKVNGV